jgi:hypothetical protein
LHTKTHEYSAQTPRREQMQKNWFSMPSGRYALSVIKRIPESEDAQQAEAAEQTPSGFLCVCAPLR